MKPIPPRAAVRATAALERRAFMLGAGSALTGTLASAAAIAAPERTAPRTSPLEDADAIRELNRRYGEALNARRPGDIASLFADDAEVLFNGGAFLRRSGVRRLYVEHFGARLSMDRHDRLEPVHTFMLASPGETEPVEFSPDGRSARACFTRLMRVEAAIASSGSLADMAREQGQGVSRWWEHGGYEVDYTKDGGAWKIRRLVYRSAPTSVPTPADLGAPPRRVPRFSSTFPKHPTGPDRLTPGDSAA